ncbi:formate/nitrite transporter family protein [Phycicoccus sp. CSK15P-2]|uniref:formate/nitrite transporter family protein n=1 Tax=Phycicoccus sp. CSK15P-2 TaxID=2807627 RepID=UPI00194E1299|nr:formate/nitrite transporter family protein [Phycicoccus sp. CSK15P-2]MBM6402830.1 formate/nitrite transporter family protein [Phycicoccus sp. CSK15P-2]
MTQQKEQSDDEIDDAFERLVEEGTERLGRPLRALVPTGLLGGIDIGVGILAYLVVKTETGNQLLAGLAFSLGFVALLLARSELFTENFLVPVTAAVAEKGPWSGLARLWVVTLVTNILGGALTVWVILRARPDLQEVARETGEHYASLGISLQSFLLAVLAGLVITLMTRMQHATDSLGVRVVPAILFGSVLVGAELFHCVLDSIFIIGAAIAGADVTVGQFLVALGWSVLGNAVGGIGLVTFLRLVRTAPKVEAERRTTPRRPTGDRHG